MDSDEVKLHRFEMGGIRFAIEQDDRWWDTEDGRKHRHELREYLERLRAHEV